MIRSDDDRDDYDDDDISDDDEDVTPRTSRSHHTSRRKKRVKNGRVSTTVDMTPPDKLLRKSEKRAHRYSKSPKKVFRVPIKP